MPWSIKERNGEFCIVKKSDNSVVHCHPTREKANAQLRALYASENKSFTYLDIESEEKPPMDESTDALVFYGGAVKALGDGKLGGYLVEFADPKTLKGSPDLEREFFAADTDYDLEEGKSATVYYDHGRDPVLKRRKLSRGKMRTDDVGVWIETQLLLRDDYEKAVYRLAELGKLGWSSGSAPHLVEKKSVGGFTKIVSWPLGDDASLTVQPANHRSQVLALKSIKSPTLENLIEELNKSELPPFSTKALEEALSAAYDDDLDTHSLKVATAVEELIAHYTKAATALDVLSGRLARKQEFRAVKDGRAFSQRRIDKMNDLISQLKKLADHPLSIAAEFEKMVKEAVATREQKDALHEAIQLQHNQFQQLKESHNHG
jgi:hypothetical protein